MQAWKYIGADNAVYDVATEALEGFQDLDEWISRGGFGPEAWQHQAA